MTVLHTSEPKPSYSPWVLPILIAVSCLSPVRIQILMSAFIRVSMVSGTLSWSLSSIAVAPSSCRFYTQNEEKVKRKEKKKSVRSDYNRGRPLKRQVSKKHVCRDCVTHSVTFFPSSAALVYHAERPQRAFRGIGYATIALCVCASADTTAPIQARPHNTLSVFFPGNLVVLWDWLQAHIGPKQGQIFDKTQG